jgi:uncharacterized membrane protein YhaH (DUF805 family)
MIGWVQHCFENFFVFKGRAGRAEYWWFNLFGLIVNLIVRYVTTIDRPVGQVAEWVFGAVLLIPGLAVTSRRMHDTGHSFRWAFYWMLPFIPMALLTWSKPVHLKETIWGPIIGAAIFIPLFGLVIYYIVLLCRQGDTSPNRYGNPAPTTPG